MVYQIVSTYNQAYHASSESFYINVTWLIEERTPDKLVPLPLR